MGIKYGIGEIGSFSSGHRSGSFSIVCVLNPVGEFFVCHHDCLLSILIRGGELAITSFLFSQ